MLKPHLGRVLLLLVVLSALPLLSQQPAVAPPKPKEEAQPAVVIESFINSIKYENDGTGVQHVEARYRITSQAGVQRFGVLAFAYPKASDTLDIDYVRVRKPDGTVIPTSSDLIDDMPADITRAAPEYSDIREKHLAVKSLAVGDVLEYAYTEHVQKPLIPGQFWISYDFTRNEVVKSEILQLDVPRDRALHVDSRTVQPTIEDKGDRRIYTWKTSNPEVQKQPQRKLLASPDVLVSTFKSWDDVGKWWSSLATERATPSPEIQAKVTALTKDAKTEDEKVRILYDYVSTHFRYIGVSFGIGRYQPHQALEVLQNGYGDCKDKHTLFTAMLQTIGIHAYAALLNSSREIDPNVPSPAQFDHVITVVPLDGKQVFLDTTTEVGPFGYLLYPIRGSRTLLVPPDGPAVLGRTPAILPYPAEDRIDVTGTLNASGVMTGKFTGELRSDREVIWRAIFRVSPPTKWKDVMQLLAYGMGYGGTISNLVISDPGDLDKPLHFSYDYTRDNYSDWSDKQITPPLPITGLGVRDDPTEKDAPTTGSIMIGGQVTVTLTSHLKLPVPNMQAPAPVHLTTDFADYSDKSTVKDGMLETTRIVTIKKSQIPVSRRADWDKFRRSVYDDENAYITVASNSGNTAPSPASSQATQLIQQAGEALQQRDINSARRMVEQALHADPKVWNGHLILAQLDMVSGAGTDAAIADMRKEIQINPTNVYAYRALGSMLGYLNRTSEAHDVWTQMVKTMPDNPEANQDLAASEYGLGHYDLAAKYYEKAISAYPDNSAILTRYADSLMKSGQSDKAIPFLEKSVALNPSPDTWNTAAFYLAEANVKLDEALKFATQAIEADEKGTAQVSLDSLQSADLQRVASLAAEWDTLGWIYFRQANYSLAGKYLTAASRVGGDAASAEHLGKLEEKKGNKAAALRYYKMSLGIDPHSDSQADIDRLTGKKFVLADINGERSLDLDQYAVTIAHTTPSAEFATYYLLVKPDGTIAAVRWVSGSKKLEAYLKQISGLGFPTLGVPDEPDVRIVRRAEFLCAGFHQKCKVTIYPARLVTSVE